MNRRFSPVFASAALTVTALLDTACDPASESTIGIQYDREEVVEMMLEAGNVDPEGVLPPVGDLALEAEPQESSGGIDACLTYYCFNTIEGAPNSNQCGNPPGAEHPLGMPGICIIADYVAECEPFMYVSGLCNDIETTTQG